MGDERTIEQVAKTEAVFREVNERIAESAEGFDADTPEFICECGNPNCTHRLEASLEEYEEVRADGATFMLAPGHEQDGVERLVEDRGRFHVVEKTQRRARAIVLRLDPRGKPKLT